MERRATEASRATQALLASQDCKDRLESPAKLDHQENKAMPGHLESRETSDPLVRLVCRVPQETRARLDQRVAQAWLETPGQLEMWDPQDRPASLDLPANPEISGHRD